jgi:hypothetical protein
MEGNDLGTCETIGNDLGDFESEIKIVGKKAGCWLRKTDQKFDADHEYGLRFYLSLK